LSRQIGSFPKNSRKACGRSSGDPSAREDVSDGSAQLVQLYTVETRKRRMAADVIRDVIQGLQSGFDGSNKGEWKASPPASGVKFERGKKLKLAVTGVFGCANITQEGLNRPAVLGTPLILRGARHRFMDVRHARGGVFL